MRRARLKSQSRSIVSKLETYFTPRTLQIHRPDKHSSRYFINHFRHATNNVKECANITRARQSKKYQEATHELHSLIKNLISVTKETGRGLYRVFQLACAKTYEKAGAYFGCHTNAECFTVPLKKSIYFVLQYSKLGIITH